MTEPRVVQLTRQAPDWRTGAIAGIIAALVYTLFVEAVNVAANGTEAFFLPFRQIGAVVLGPRALNASYDLFAAALAGTVVHLGIAAAFGILVAWITSHATQSSGTSVAISVVAGLAFYGLDVFVIFPTAFPWFLSNDRLVQSIGHGVFGAVTGAWIAWRRSADRGQIGLRSRPSL